MPAVKEEIIDEIARYQAAIQAWNEQSVPRAWMYNHQNREEANLWLFTNYFS